MSYENWKDKAQGFQNVDVRHIQGSFFEGLKKRAEALEVGEGLHIIQTFEPHPLYAVMEGLGYEHHTEQRSEAEFHVWLFAKLGLPEGAKDEEQSEQRRLCREVLTNKIRTHQALLKYCFGEKNVKSFKTLR